MLVSLAWRNLWRHARRSLITASAMSVGVAMCMAMMSLTDGTYARLFEVMVEQQLGHLQVHHPEWPTKRNQHDTVSGTNARIRQIEATVGVAAVSPRLYGQVLAGGPVRTSGAAIVGVDPVREATVGPIAGRVKQGRWLGEAPANEAVLGEGLAKELRVGLGDDVVVVTQASDGSLANELVTVVGLVVSGQAAMDRGGLWMHLHDLQSLLVLPDQAHDLIVLSRESDRATIEAAVVALRETLGDDVAVVTWWQASPQAAEMIGMQSYATGIMLFLVFTAAAFGVLNTMWMSVFERTRELGVLLAIGMRPGRVVVMIVAESLMLGGLSASIGLVLGGMLVGWLVVYGLDFSASMGDGYAVAGVVIDPVLYGQFNVSGVLAVVSAVFVVSGGASFWPAWRASRLQPVLAIRSE